MASKKISRKKLLNEPDEFITTTSRVIQFFQTHQKQIYRAALIVLIIIAAGAGGFYYLRGKEERALVLQDQGLRIYQEAYRTAMENPTADKKEDFQKALQKFREASAAYNWGNTAQTSQLYIGNCYFAMKDYDQAQASYARCVEGPYRPLALNGMAYAFEAKGDYNKALENYQQSAGDRESPFQLESLLGAARCYELLNQKPKALEIYEKALTQFSKSNMIEFLRWKVSELKG